MGISGSLDFQGIVEMVGNKLREVLKSDDIGVDWLDYETQSMKTLYVIEHGKPLNIPDRTVDSDEHWARICARRLPIVEHTAAEMIATGNVAMPGTDQCLSRVSVPIVVGDQRVGTIDMENHEREYAFGESEVRLLTTIASSMGVALQSALLFDETQRLLKETEQRNAEMAVINSIQQGIAAELNFQAIVDLVGDKLREVLKTEDIGIRLIDPKTGLVHYLYEYEHGKRLQIAPAKPKAGGPSEKMQKTLAPVVYGTREELAKSGISTLPGTDAAQSIIFVPIVSGERLTGSLLLEDHEREHAFGDSEIRLLTTVASSMGVALENARLFDETQRLLKETEQRNAELAVINSIQQGLVAQLDLMAIVDLVGDKLREVFATGNVSISWFDDDEFRRDAGLQLRKRPAIDRSAGDRRCARSERNMRVINERVAVSQQSMPAGAAAYPGTSLPQVGPARTGRCLGASHRNRQSRQLRTRKRLQRRRCAAADHRLQRRWAWRCRARASSTRRSGC